MSFLTVLSLVLLFFRCSSEDDSSQSDNQAPSQLSSGPVVVQTYFVKAGDPSRTVVRKGLHASVVELERVVADARKAAPGLHGWFEGTLHVEPDGTVRMVAEGESALQNAGAARIVDSFVGSTFAKNWVFPEVGEHCLVYVKYQIKKAR